MCERESDNAVTLPRMIQQDINLAPDARSSQWRRSAVRISIRARVELVGIIHITKKGAHQEL